MFRLVAQRAAGVLRSAVSTSNAPRALAVRHVSHSAETDDELDARYVAYFSRTDIDGWEVRKAMNDIAGMDIVPEPIIVTAALKACRRVNDYALAVRFLEVIKSKCGPNAKEIYPWIIQEVRPTLTELGIDTPEELGYDKPELGLKTIYEV